METLPVELQHLIMSYAHPIHPCKEELNRRLSSVPEWHLWLHAVPWDEMSNGVKDFCYAEEQTGDYGY